MYSASVSFTTHKPKHGEFCFRRLLNLAETTHSNFTIQSIGKRYIMVKIINYAVFIIILFFQFEPIK